MLSKQAITKYQIIHKKLYGFDISEAETIRQGLLLLDLVKAIRKPMPKQQQIPLFRKT